MRANSNQRRGVTVFEVVVAIVVMGLGLPPLIGLFREIASAGAQHAQERSAIELATVLMEEIVSKSFEDPDELAGSFGAEEPFRSAYDDIDDYHGLDEQPPVGIDGVALSGYAGFRRRTIVETLKLIVPSVPPIGAGLPPAAPSVPPSPFAVTVGGTSEYKRVRVRVSWTGEGAGEYALTTLRTKLGPDVPSGPTGPIDVGVAEGSVEVKGKDKLKLALFNPGTTDLELSGFSLSASVSGEVLRKMKLDGDTVWDVKAGAPVPTGPLTLNKGKAKDRTIAAGKTESLEIEFKDDPDGTIDYELKLDFTDGSTILLSFTVAW